MTFAFDTGPDEGPFVISANLDGQVSYRKRGTDAERVHRKLICTIQEIETADALDAYYEAESIILDALWLDYPQYAKAVVTAYEDHRILLTGEYWSAAQVSAQRGSRSRTDSGTPSAQPAHDGKDGNERKDDECIW